MNYEFIQFLGVTLLGLANIILLFWQARKRMPTEIRKTEAEQYESLSEAAESNMDGARISNDILKERIREMRRERRDLMNYIAILKRQIIEEAHLQPAPYTPTESDPSIPKVQ